MTNIPDGFERMHIESPFLKAIGPFYHRREGNTLIIGVRAAKKHCNSMGIVHGGVLSALADLAMGFDVALSGERLRSATTVGLSMDFFKTARVGDWLEARVEHEKEGRSLIMGNIYIHGNGSRIARTSVIFSIDSFVSSSSLYWDRDETV